MPILSLTSEEQEQLKALWFDYAFNRDDDIRHRIDALTSIAMGLPISQVAAMAGVTRGTIYNWVRRFTADPSEPLLNRLTDRSRSGRPRKALSDEKKDEKFAKHVRRRIRSLIKTHKMSVEYVPENNFVQILFTKDLSRPYAGRSQEGYGMGYELFTKYFSDLHLNYPDAIKKPPRVDRGEDK